MARSTCGSLLLYHCNMGHLDQTYLAARVHLRARTLIEDYRLLERSNLIESRLIKHQKGPAKNKIGRGPMRRIRYSVAMSLDGFVAGPNGEADWIIMDPEIDFNAHFQQFDTFLMGRRTYEPMAKAGQGGQTPGTRTFVVSRTLQQRDHPHVTI